MQKLQGIWAQGYTDKNRNTDNESDCRMIWKKKQ